MFKFLLVLLYLYSGEVRLEQHGYTTMEACVRAAEERVLELDLDPKYEAGLYGACMGKVSKGASLK